MSPSDAPFPLSRHFPRLGNLPRTPLLACPTPVSSLHRLATVLGSAPITIKRNDHLDGVYGGGKLRQLEFHLGEALQAGADVVLTSGSVGSNHVLATALAAGRLGLRTRAMLIPQPGSSLVRRNLLLTHQHGAELVPFATGTSMRTESEATRAQVQHLAAEGHRVHVIPFGGSGGHGVLGHVSAGLELADQIRDGTVEEPARIYVAAAFGTTAAGLLLGLRAAGIRSRLVAVRVVERAFFDESRMFESLQNSVALLRSLDPDFPLLAFTSNDVEVRHEFAGRAYGEPTQEGAHAARLLGEHEGIALDACYTSKAFAAIVEDAARRRDGDAGVLFWHSGNGCDTSRGVSGLDHRTLPRLLHHYFEEPCHALDAAFTVR